MISIVKNINDKQLLIKQKKRISDTVISHAIVLKYYKAPKTNVLLVFVRLKYEIENEKIKKDKTLISV